MKTVSIMFDNWKITIFWVLFLLYYTPDVCMKDYAICKLRETANSVINIF